MQRDGILLVDKASGQSSHDVVAKARRFVGTRKIGHAGTLDPMATGLLILGVNRGTKFLTYLVGESKTYLATFRLGQSTTTDDAQGEVISSHSAADLLLADIHTSISALTGDIMQVPSSVSALKIRGQRAYNLVRAGQEVKLAARPITIHSFEVRAVRLSGLCLELEVKIHCSSGTYIRALARDMGADLGVGGHVTALRRTAVGSFSVEDAAPIESLEHHRSLLSISDVVKNRYLSRELTPAEALHLQHGRKISASEHANIYAGWCGGELIALLKNTLQGARSEMMVKIQ